MSELHPLLRDPERARAFELLLENPNGTFRTWGELLGWKHSRVTRFLASLEREGLVLLATSKFGTLITPVIPGTKPEQDRNTLAGTKPTRGRNVPDTRPERLGSKALDQLPRSRAGSDFAADIIDGLNGALRGRFDEQAPLILYDNRSSNATALRLQRAGVDVAWAIKQLWHDVQLFHPEKHGNGQLPKSLAYFEKGLLKKWNEREQLVAPRLVATVERGEKKRGGVPMPIGEITTALLKEQFG